jgi:hypothetical protein
MASIGLRAAIILLFSLGTLSIPAGAQEAGGTMAADIRTGSCEAPAATAAALAAIAFPPGAPAGAGTAVAVASSYSVVPIAIDVMLASEHSIHVVGQDGQVLACGNVGGSRDVNGALSIGIRPGGGSAFGGIAYMTPIAGAPAQTGISVFVAELGEGPGAGAAATPTPVSKEEYTRAVRGQVTLMVASLQRVDALVAAHQPGVASWTDQIAAELALWRILHKEAVALVPPPELEAFHARYTEATALLDSAAGDIMQALESGDQQLLTTANEKVDRAIQMLRALDAPDATPAATPPA